MPENARFRCNNCGNRFDADVLTRDETRDLERRNRATSPLHCPKCNRTDLRRGWE